MAFLLRARCEHLIRSSLQACAFRQRQLGNIASLKECVSNSEGSSSKWKEDLHLDIGFPKSHCTCDEFDLDEYLKLKYAKYSSKLGDDFVDISADTYTEEEYVFRDGEYITSIISPHCTIAMTTNCSVKPFITSEVVENSHDYGLNQSHITGARQHIPFSSYPPKASSSIKDKLDFMSNNKDEGSSSDDKKKQQYRERLQKVQMELDELIPKVIGKRHNYTLYHRDVVIENNYRQPHYMTRGMGRLALEVAKFKIWTEWRFLNPQVTVLRSSMDEAAGAVLMHVRLQGMRPSRLVRPWMLRVQVAPAVAATGRTDPDGYRVIEAVCTFHVADVGMIDNIRIDKVLLDGEKLETPLTRRQKLLKKLLPNSAIAFRKS